MGGFGSGRRGYRIKVESCSKIDIRSLQRRGELGHSVTLQYGNGWTVVSIVRTECNFGGSRPWFECPHCKQRVGVLYSWGKLACRKCFRLSYSSQREDSFHRALRRMGKIAERLGGEYGNFPDKPKRMRWATYERFYEQYDAADDIANAGINWDVVEEMLALPDDLVS